MRNSNTYKLLRIAAGVMGLMMLVLVLFSAFYIAAEADHDCSGEDCPVCACIHHCENILRGIGDATSEKPAVAPVFLLLLAAVFVIPAASRDTLISRKVRLNN